MSAPAADRDAEREIDLSGWRDSLVQRWWIVAVGVVGGIVLGAVYSLSGGSVHEASVLIAPGQVFNQGGGRILNYQSSPRGIDAIVTDPSAIKRAAAVAHMPISQLRGHVHTETVATGAGNAAQTGFQLVRITVTGHKPRKIEQAADALAEIVKNDTTGRFVRQQIVKLNGRIENFNRNLATLQKQIDQYTAVLDTETLPPLDRLVLVNQLQGVIQQQGNLNDKVFSTEQTLTLLNTIEIAQIITNATAQKTTARSRRNSILVGALLGLIVGVIVALVVDRRATRVVAA
jgi:capsular polysaccharide biosynthesis protein